MKNKYKWMLAVILCVCTLITSCSSEMKPVDENNTNTDTDFFVYVDPKTGVNYIVFDGYNAGGITVRYNSDGSIMITEKDGEVDVSR